MIVSDQAVTEEFIRDECPQHIERHLIGSTLFEDITMCASNVATNPSDSEVAVYIGSDSY